MRRRFANVPGLKTLSQAQRTNAVQHTSLPLDLTRDALFLDIDGTLLDIAPRAQDVCVPPSLVRDLTHLYSKLGGALALLSGRTLDAMDALFTPLRLPASGAHGAMWRKTPDSVIEQADALPARLRQEITAAFSDAPSLFIEDKGLTLAIHCRQAPAKADAIEATLQTFLDKHPNDGLSLLHGRKVMEIVRTGFDKGAALRALMAAAPFQGRRPVFLGDDITDLSAIAASEALGGIGLRIGRSAAAPSSPQEVRDWIASLTNN